MTVQPKAGELLVGSYLRLVNECELMMYNQRSPKEGNQLEIDVIGVDKTTTDQQQVYVCEVTTHLRGVQYGNYQQSLDKIEKKFERDKGYITEVFPEADLYSFQLWSSVVKPGLKKRLPELQSVFEADENMRLDLVVNGEYSNRIGTLKQRASETAKQHGELDFRVLQILEHVK